MASIMLLLHACGILLNGYLYRRLYKSWNSSTARNVNKKIAFHLLLNISNLVCHAAMEVSQQKFWLVLSTNFSFQTIYFLTAIELVAALGRQAQEQINSFVFITVLAFFTTGLSAVFGGRYDICGTNNCFNQPNMNLKEEDDTAILKIYYVQSLFPTSVILISSIFVGYRKLECVNKASNPEQNWASRLTNVCSSCAVALFLVYGSLVAEIILFSVESEDSTWSGHICQMSCLYNELYLLLSIFPVGYLVQIVKRNSAGIKQVV
ncbi:uncharacterized protein [Montipora capricornis]|uniref:uncharacterized protein n=1 Tax=Montipora capricornis TaxID=246305 RepID=UPI0035F13C30